LRRAVGVSPLPPGECWAVLSSEHRLDPVDVLSDRERGLVDVEQELVQVESRVIIFDFDEGVALVILISAKMTANNLVGVGEG